MRPLFTINDFEMRDQNLPNPDVYASLSQCEKELVKKIKLVEVKREKGTESAHFIIKGNGKKYHVINKLAI